MANEHAIGFMDSGVGGLTVVKQALKQLRAKQFILLVIRRVCHTVRDQLNKCELFLFRWRIS